MEKYEYQIRVDNDAVVWEKFLEWLPDNAEAWIIGFEMNTKGENIHYQGYVRSDKKEQALRKSLKKILLKKGNAAYSLSAMRDKYDLLQYVCKDEVIKTSKGFTPEELEGWKKIGSENKVKYEEKKQKKREKPPTTLDKIYEKITWPISVKNLFKEVVRWYVTTGRIIPVDTQLIQIVKTLRVRRAIARGDIQFDEYLDDWASRIYDVNSWTTQIPGYVPFDREDPDP